jgi:hypothetical protein
MGNVVRHLRNTGDKLVEVGGWNECGSASTRHLHPLDAAQLQAWSAWSSLPSVGAEIATNKAVLREAGRIVSDRVSMGLGSSASLSFAGVVLVTVAALGFLSRDQPRCSCFASYAAQSGPARAGRNALHDLLERSGIQFGPIQ